MMQPMKSNGEKYQQAENTRIHTYGCEINGFLPSMRTSWGHYFNGVMAKLRHGRYLAEQGLVAIVAIGQHRISKEYGANQTVD